MIFSRCSISSQSKKHILHAYVQGIEIQRDKLRSYSRIMQDEKSPLLIPKSLHEIQFTPQPVRKYALCIRIISGVKTPNRKRFIDWADARAKRCDPMKKLFRISKKIFRNRKDMLRYLRPQGKIGGWRKTHQNALIFHHNVSAVTPW